jgi:tRNA threonylcarbamoyladenosine biosynthesis protein TsaB
MLVLGIDTSGKQGGVALVRGDNQSGEVVASVDIAGGSYSAQLMPQVTAVLDRAGVDKHDLEAIVVASGPGSFTGLRVGIAAAKALAEVLAKPIAAVTVLEAIAADVFATTSCETVIALLDAGRGEAYLARYAVSDQGLQLLCEAMVRQSESLAAASPSDSESVVIATPDALVLELLEGSGREVVLVQRPDAAAIARIGIRNLVRGAAADVAMLDANYIRRSDAELFSLPKIERELKS